MPKQLPPEIVTALAKLKKKRKRKVPIDEATRQKFVEWGKQGHRKAKPKLDRETLRAAGKKGGETFLRAFCLKHGGINYDDLPDAVTP